MIFSKFGSGRNPLEAFITFHLGNGFKRKATMWDVEKEILEKINKIAGKRYSPGLNYGATPSSAIRSTVDLMISGDDLKF